MTVKQRFLAPRGPRWWILGGLVALLFVSSAEAAKSRQELLFELNAALLANDRAAFARCFFLTGADEKTRVSFGQIIDQIFAWPTHHIYATDRKDAGPARITQDGRPYAFNGDWQFQVHIYLSKKTAKGFVFPAGPVRNGQVFILAAVPEAPPSP